MDKVTLQVMMENEDGRELQVTVEGVYHPFRKGDGWGAYNGPTPDDPEELELEEMFLIRRCSIVRMSDNHRFWDRLDYGNLLEEYLDTKEDTRW